MQVCDVAAAEYHRCERATPLHDVALAEHHGIERATPMSDKVVTADLHDFTVPTRTEECTLRPHRRR
jgi:hypothetical protein